MEYLFISENPDHEKGAVHEELSVSCGRCYASRETTPKYAVEVDAATTCP